MGKWLRNNAWWYLLTLAVCLFFEFVILMQPAPRKTKEPIIFVDEDDDITVMGNILHFDDRDVLAEIETLQPEEMPLFTFEIATDPVDIEIASYDQDGNIFIKRPDMVFILLDGKKINLAEWMRKIENQDRSYVINPVSGP